jgi:DNA-binding MarR family transcriptional regulator
MVPASSSLSVTARDLRIAVGRVGRRLRDLYATMPTAGEVSFAEVSLLSRLRREGSTSPGALAEAEHVTAQAVGSVLGVMQRKGLIDRAPDPTDGRKVVVTLTDAGQHAFDHRGEEVSEHLARVLGQEFTPAERARLAAAVPLLERLADRL